MELPNIEVTLKPSQNFTPGERIIEVDVSALINVSLFNIQPRFVFNAAAFGQVKKDEAAPGRIIIPVKNDIKLPGIEEELSVRYFATSKSGETITGKIIFPEAEYEIGVPPITYELDSNCQLPDIIKINVRNYSGGRSVSLTSIDENDTNAATITLVNDAGNDYNNDYNDDYGHEPNQVIVYTLNKSSTFWKTLGASTRFKYNVSYRGKTASNFITIKLSNQTFKSY